MRPQREPWKATPEDLDAALRGSDWRTPSIREVEAAGRQPIIGEYYRVPVMDLGKGRGLVPIRPWVHSDEGQPRPHVHIDNRFVNEDLLDRLDVYVFNDHEPPCIAEVAFMDTQGEVEEFAKDNPHCLGMVEVLLKCVAANPVTTPRAHGVTDGARPGIQRDGKWHCPHRNYDLSAVLEDQDGVRICPMHGQAVLCRHLAP